MRLCTIDPYKCEMHKSRLRLLKSYSKSKKTLLQNHTCVISTQSVQNYNFRSTLIFQQREPEGEWKRGGRLMTLTPIAPGISHQLFPPVSILDLMRVALYSMASPIRKCFQTLRRGQPEERRSFRGCQRAHGGCRFIKHYRYCKKRAMLSHKHISTILTIAAHS